MMLTIVECSSLPDRHPWAWHESLQNLELACLDHSFALRKHGLTTRPSFASFELQMARAHCWQHITKNNASWTGATRLESLHCLQKRYKARVE